jgi:hypothetical protein
MKRIHTINKTEKQLIIKKNKSLPVQNRTGSDQYLFEKQLLSLAMDLSLLLSALPLFLTV